MYALISIVLGYLTNFVLIKLFLFFCFSFLVPFVFNRLVSSFIDTSKLTEVFNALPPNVWYFLELFRFDFGLPLLISAVVAHFLIRRIPLIGG